MLSLVKVWRIQKAFKQSDYKLQYGFQNINSLEPFIDTNTAVVCETITEQVLQKQPLQVGDIVVWHTADPSVEEPRRIHRIIDRIAKTQKRLLTVK